MSLPGIKRTTAISLFFHTPQNGVLDKALIGPYTGGAADSARMSMDPFKLATEDEVDNCTDEVDGCFRPLRSGKNGVGKGLKFETPFPRSTNADGSLPTSPDTPIGLPDFASSLSKLENQTFELLRDFYLEYPDLSRLRKNRMLNTLRRVVEDVVQKHKIAFNGMVQKLKLGEQPDDMQVVGSVAKSIFSDGTTNWGRIATLVAFGALVSQRLKEAKRESCVENVALQISSYLSAYQSDWLLNNKGWDGFVEFFHVEDPESAVRNALMAVASVAGLGAGLALLIR
ncbi:induced myeloid leukemia cell differentiation protein Mcl-1a [Chanos chanos]|uniref:Induced myeloid leukemia cell differentiation protein Mcl-1a n=1 Tax=Chanos chanos TaxID=29144 RepID=A0A6J2WKZ6_CHACN|nr:induced myeloid leukemia cell differentiation protein Mcl-1 homolog [Chanos chanos]